MQLYRGYVGFRASDLGFETLRVQGLGFKGSKYLYMRKDLVNGDSNGEEDGHLHENQGSTTFFMGALDLCRVHLGAELDWKSNSDP